MPINNFKPFSADVGANVTSQADYEALPALKSGFTAGKASSAQVNKAIRQGTFIASAIAQFVADKTGQDVLDNGDVNGFVTKLVTGLSEQSLSRTNPFADIKSDGAQAVSTALANLGLGEGSALPVGVPVPWPLAIPPVGWLKYNGAAFDKVANPKLALIYPSGVLPDLRGEFIRGWDDGRGADPARILLSYQSSQNVAHVHDATLMFVQANGSVRASVTISEGQGPYGDRMTSSGGNESRPRNIAFNYIVRAA